MSIRKAAGSAVVVGASLAGLMTGIALSRAGLQVTIVERASTHRPSGAALQVDSGEFDQTPIAKFLRYLASGGMRSSEAWSSVEARLRKAALVNSHIDLRFDTRVKTVAQDEELAWVVTDQGEAFYGDILIGADGHRSTVRAQVAPHKPNATFAGYLIWVSILNEQDIPRAYWPPLQAQFAMPSDIGVSTPNATLATRVLFID